MKLNSIKKIEKTKSGRTILNLNNYSDEFNKPFCKSKSKVSENKLEMFNMRKKTTEVKFDFFKYFKLYYFCPLWVIKNKKNANFLFSIKNSICNTFSFENFIELIKVSKSINSIRGEILIRSPSEFNVSFKQPKN